MPVRPDVIARGLGARAEQILTPPEVRYRVYGRDASYRRTGELTSWQSLTIRSVFNGVGSWDLQLAAEDIARNTDSAGTPILDKTGGIIVTQTIGSTTRVIFSGSVSTEWTWTANTLHAAGKDDMALLEEPARPTPSLAEAPYPDEYDVRTGVASTIMRQLVSVNIGQAAPSGPKIAALTLAADPAIGTTITSRARLDPLITLLAELAVTPYAGGLGFRLQQSAADSNSLEFSVGAPVDNSADAKFAVELGTAIDFRDEWRAPDGNHFVVAAGDGFGPNRTIVEGGDADSIAEVGRRITRFIDARGITDLAELNQKLAEALAGAVSSRKVQITPIELPSLRWGIHYDLGTLVTFSARGETKVDLIREIVVDLSPTDGAVVTPTMGDAGTGNDDRMASYVDSVAHRLEYLQKNWNVPPDSITREMLHFFVKPPIGEVRYLAHSTVPPGYVSANGDIVSQTTYAALYAALGGGAISTHWDQTGAGAGQFKLPDLRGRVPLGLSGSHAVGSTGGAESVNSQHDHPGATHDHPIDDHSHPIANHSHPLDDHDHDPGTYRTLSSSTEGPSSETNNLRTISPEEADAASKTHAHFIDEIDVIGKSGSAHKVSGGADFNQTGDKTGMVTNDKTGMVTDGFIAGAGTTGPGGSTTLAIMPPFATLYPVIFSGV